MEEFDRLARAYSGPIETRDDFRRFLTALFLDLDENPNEWVNTDLRDFLSTMAWYAGESLDNSYRNTGRGETPTGGNWRVLADLMMTARIID